MTIARPGISLFPLMEKNSISRMHTKGFFLITTLRGSVTAVCHPTPLSHHEIQSMNEFQYLEKMVLKAIQPFYTSHLLQSLHNLYF